MKSKIVFICAVFFGCTESRNIYPVSGVVKDINVGDNIVIVDHDSIRNFMMPMVMPFNVIRKSEISDFYIGDSIKFELVVGDTFSYAQNLTLVNFFRFSGLVFVVRWLFLVVFEVQRVSKQLRETC